MERVTYSEEELLASIAYDEPLIAGEVRCHGGFVAGRYRSPRTAYRAPAIGAWQAQLRARGLPLVDVAPELVPPHYPNASQAVLLLREGVRDPITRTLTTIAIIEGFGAMIRDQPVPDLARCVRDSLDGTATAHLRGGLFEAHARDEAGWGDEGGHRQMWFGARDVAFEQPLTDDETETMLERMGIKSATGGPGRLAAMAREVPDLDSELELMLRRMIGLLFIEVSAFHVFAWAEAVLADTELVAGDGEGARVVSYIRADEEPHVAYLATALTEMRDRTFVTEAGGRIAGEAVIGHLWDLHLADSLGSRRRDAIATFDAELDAALAANPNAASIREEFDSLAVSM
jgi:hypothetical protein